VWPQRTAQTTSGLVQLKRKFDPDTVFHLNQNIPPWSGQFRRRKSRPVRSDVRSGRVCACPVIDHEQIQG
jgi:hypothetical protein